MSGVVAPMEGNHYVSVSPFFNGVITGCTFLSWTSIVSAHALIRQLQFHYISNMRCRFGYEATPTSSVDTEVSCHSVFA